MPLHTFLIKTGQQSNGRPSLAHDYGGANKLISIKISQGWASLSWEAERT